MQWLGPWLIDNQFQDSVSAVCAHPTSLLGRSVQTLSLEEFVCGLFFYIFYCSQSDLLYRFSLVSTEQ